ncbi:MAG: hypothetical protein MI807_17285 [Verrucomicrobiales bacterium]|nr:hypothetical protein [Verrucomicrobiales bacterium]
MASSIDPVDNMFGTGTSLLQRILIGFGAGWFGNLLSRICASITSWDDVINPMEIVRGIFEDFDTSEVLGFVFWPLILIYYLAKIPLYALIVAPMLALFLVRIVLTDDPVLFWSLAIIATLTPGLVISDGSLWSLVPLVFMYIGLGAGLWWAVNYEHGEWIDGIKDFFERDKT